MEITREILALLIPVGIIQLGLMTASLISVVRSNTFKVGSKPLWVLVSFISIIGPILYFTLGRDTDREED